MNNPLPNKQMSRTKKQATENMSSFSFGGQPTTPAFGSYAATFDGVKKEILQNELQHLSQTIALLDSRTKLLKQSLLDTAQQKPTETDVQIRLAEINLLIAAIAKIKLT